MKLSSVSSQGAYHHENLLMSLSNELRAGEELTTSCYEKNLTKSGVLSLSNVGTEVKLFKSPKNSTKDYQTS